MRDHSALLSAVRQSLAPDLLSPKWRKLVEPGDPSTTGHCYIGAESLWNLIGARESGYRPMVISGGDWTHWYLANGPKLLDPTADQLPDGPPYHQGRACGFLSREPSKRARIVIERVTQERK
jgi:hypothetical protein